VFQRINILITFNRKFKIKVIKLQISKNVYDIVSVDMGLTTLKDILKNQNSIYQNKKKLIPPP